MAIKEQHLLSSLVVKIIENKTFTGQSVKINFFFKLTISCKNINFMLCCLYLSLSVSISISLFLLDLNATWDEVLLGRSFVFQAKRSVDFMDFK